MTISKLLALASAAALLGGVACSDSSRARENNRPMGSPSDTTSTSAATSTPEGRRGPVLPRARMDGGTDLNSPSGTSGAVGSPSTGTDTTSGTSSGTNADPNAPASGTTPGGTGQTPSNGSDTGNNPGK